MTADMNSIAVGYEGMKEMLSGLFGKAEAAGIGQRPGRPPGKPPAPPPEVPVIIHDTKNLPKLTPAAFDKMFTNVKGKPN